MSRPEAVGESEGDEAVIDEEVGKRPGRQAYPNEGNKPPHTRQKLRRIPQAESTEGLGRWTARTSAWRAESEDIRRADHYAR